MMWLLVLTRDGPAKPLKYFDRLASADYWQRGHQAATSTCLVSIVRGMPFSDLTSRHNLIASLMLSRACSLVFPWLTHPGIDGHSTTNTSSSSRSIVTLKTISVPLLFPCSPMNSTGSNASRNPPETSSPPIESATLPHHQADKTICLRCCRRGRAATARLPAARRHFQRA